tara:strand:+ start:1285 stop:1458 length:174 start_codon:yes stop_codon:yes gene_type:complete
MPKFEVTFTTLVETSVVVTAKNAQEAGFAVEDGEGIILRIPSSSDFNLKKIKQREPE